MSQAIGAAPPTDAKAYRRFDDIRELWRRMAIEDAWRLFRSEIGKALPGGSNRTPPTKRKFW